MSSASALILLYSKFNFYDGKVVYDAMHPQAFQRGPLQTLGVILNIRYAEPTVFFVLHLV